MKSRNLVYLDEHCSVSSLILFWREKSLDAKPYTLEADENCSGECKTTQKSAITQSTGLNELFNTVSQRNM